MVEREKTQWLSQETLIRNLHCCQNVGFSEAFNTEIVAFNMSPKTWRLYITCGWCLEVSYMDLKICGFRNDKIGEN